MSRGSGSGKGIKVSGFGETIRLVREQNQRNYMYMYRRNVSEPKVSDYELQVPGP